MKSGLLSSLGLVLKAYRSTFVFRGRATRTEMLVLLLLATLIGMAGVALLTQLDPIDYGHPFGTTPGHTGLLIALNAIPFLPMIAMLHRRAHDFGWPGWPSALLGSIAIAFSIWRGIDVSALRLDLYPAWTKHVRVPGLFAFYCTMLGPPQRGPNRYGLDPRV